ncbi:MAG: DUF6122 family protein [Candidatus Pacebacteria bacterium]|nr:DUF6122 family protein [Candidatus Paceibacterota bacterium]
MTTPTHIAVSLGTAVLISKFGITYVSNIDLILLFSAELMDFDHLFSKPIYHPKRDPFKTHFLHKNWITLFFVSIILLFIRSFAFLGIGILLHLLLDYIYVKRINK